MEYQQIVLQESVESWYVILNLDFNEAENLIEVFFFKEINPERILSLHGRNQRRISIHSEENEGNCGKSYGGRGIHRILN